jgi:proton glutamate symport protein
MIISIKHVVIALIGGVVAGLLFGPYCAILDSIGKVYFMLLQMAALPYIPSLLVHGLGSLSFPTAKKLLKKSWIVFLLLWATSLITIYLFTLLIPPPSTFLSDSSNSKNPLITQNLLSYLVPKNLFYDLTYSIVPAVALFGLIAGVALIWVKEKLSLLDVLSSINSGIEQIFYWLAKCAPIVIFSHLAVTVGTVQLADFEKIEFYVLLFILTSLFFTFVLFPLLITNLTRLTYKEVFREIQEVCFIPFMACFPTLAFPFLIKTIRRFFQRHKLFTQETTLSTQAILPLSFTFAQVGNIFIVLIISFLALYTRHNIDKVDATLLPFLSLPMSFGTVYSSISSLQFLLDALNFPSHAFIFFQQTSALTLNFQVLVSVSGILTMTLLVLSSHYGMLKIRLKRLCIHLFLCFAAIFLCVLALRPHIHFPDNFTDLYPNLRMEKALGTPLSVTIYKNRAHVPENKYANLPTLQRILQTGILRVGYFSLEVPFCYWNRYNELVGYDMSFAYKLAQDLNCKLELIPMGHDAATIKDDLDSGFYDIFMSALVMTEYRLENMAFSKPYFEQNNVLIVPLNQKESYQNLSTVKATPGLKIGGVGAYYETIERNFPLAEAVMTHNMSPLLDKQVNAILWSSLSSFIWSLSNPEFGVVQYGDLLGKRYLSYAMKKDQPDWLDFIQDWLILKDQSGFAKIQYDYWILGIQNEPPHERWSVLRMLFDWIKK